MKKAKLKYKFVLNTFIFLLIKILLGMQNGENLYSFPHSESV